MVTDTGHATQVHAALLSVLPFRRRRRAFSSARRLGAGSSPKWLPGDALRGAALGATRRAHRRRLGAPPAIETAIVLGRAEDLLHVILRLRKRDVVDELVAVDARPLGNPAGDATRAGVVGRQRVVHSAELLDQIREVRRADLQVGVGRGQHADRELPRQLQHARVLTAGGGNDLHQPVGVGDRPDVRRERRLLRDRAPRSCTDRAGARPNSAESAASSSPGRAP